MVSPDPNRSPGIGLLHTTEAGVEDGSSEDGDRGVGGAASARCRWKRVTRKYEDQRQRRECICPVLPDVTYTTDNGDNRKKRNEEEREALPGVNGERTGR